MTSHSPANVFKLYGEFRKFEVYATEELDLFRNNNAIHSSTLYGNFSGLIHTQLDSHAWIDFFPQWLQNSQELFYGILAHTPWQIQQRMMYDREITTPRLVYGYRLEQANTPDILDNMGSSLNRYYGLSGHPPFISAGLCLYRNENDSVAWHGDSVKRLIKQNPGYTKIPQALVAIVSLGATRPLLLRPKNSGGPRKFIAHSGDLLVMGGTCQSTWEHCIPKSSQYIGPRISIQFRPAGVH